MKNRSLSRAQFAGLTFTIAIAAIVLLPAQSRAQGPPSPKATLIVSGLDNPKQPAVGPDGAVYIALSGHAGPTDPLLNGVPFNKTGAVVKVTPSGTVLPVVSGLLSRYDENSSIGPSGVAWWRGSLYVAQGLNDPLNGVTDSLLSSPVLKIAGGKTRTFTSFNAFPFDPTAASDADTNPFACTVGGDGRLYVADGGENGVWRIDEDGDASLYVQFPGDPTLTGIAPIKSRRYVERRSERNSFGGLVVCLFGNGKSGFANGSVQIANEWGQSTLVPAGVITMPISVAWSPGGKLYVLQFATPNPNPGPPFVPGSGAIWSVTTSGVATKVLSGLNFPTGLCFAPDGTAYVTNNGVLPGVGPVTGQLVKVTGL